jgi:hypothetical protein
MYLVNIIIGDDVERPYAEVYASVKENVSALCDDAEIAILGAEIAKDYEKSLLLTHLEVKEAIVSVFDK